MIGKIWEVRLKPIIESNIHYIDVRIECEELSAVFSTLDTLFPDYDVIGTIQGFTLNPKVDTQGNSMEGGD